MSRVLRAADLLKVWDQGFRASPTQRALFLMQLVFPQHSINALSQVSIGDRDRILMSLRKRLFGNQITSVDSCPKCSEKVEIQFSVDQPLQIPSSTETRIEHEFNHQVLCFRTINSADLLNLQKQQHETTKNARLQLINRCLVNADDQDEIEFTDEQLTSLSAKLSDADPLADFQLDLKCECHHTWKRRFDIVTYLWEELQQYCLRQLREIHALAVVYGWTEETILSLSSARRSYYLQMMGR